MPQLNSTVQPGRLKRSEMKKALVSIIVFLVTATCQNTPDSIPLGSWDYDIYINDVKTGTARFSTEKTGNTYVCSSFMQVFGGDVINTTEQVLIETTDFKPVKLEIHNKIIHGDTVEKIDTVARFKGGQVTLTVDGMTSTVVINRPFVLDGNIYLHELIKAGFKKGTSISLSVYEPSIEIDEPVTMHVSVMGRKTVSVGGRIRPLIHITQAIAGIKSIDVYIDNRGVTHKAVIEMLNNRLELIKQ